MTLRNLVPVLSVLSVLPLALNHPACAEASGATPPPKVAPGSYECWAFGSPRMLLNLRIVGEAQYANDAGQRGRFTYEQASGRITFKGGHLDGAMPDGFVVVYHEPRGRPTLSFRSPRGAEASFCERTGT